tara:strand:- start:493 stop:969 length:477 start_codon:yes stop_codon:yes gene_type:complete
MESINGKESVEDLIAMVDRQDDGDHIGGVIAMICMTTQFTNPATFNQFTKKLKQDRPEIYDKCKDAFSASGSNASDTNNNSGCFVATATMRNYNHPIVLDLRNFRDLFLLKSWYGRLFVKSYYLVGPFFARLISKSKLLRSLSFNLLIVPIHNLIKKI